MPCRRRQRPCEGIYQIIASSFWIVFQFLATLWIVPKVEIYQKFKSLKHFYSGNVVIILFFFLLPSTFIGRITAPLCYFFFKVALYKYYYHYLHLIAMGRMALVPLMFEATMCDGRNFPCERVVYKARSHANKIVPVRRFDFVFSFFTWNWTL